MKTMFAAYAWHKEQLWTQVAIILASSFLLYAFELNPFFVFLIYIFTATKIILGLKLMNVNPVSVNDQENFSWKYLQALPVSKKEIYHFYLWNSFFSFSPVILLFLCLHHHLARVVFETTPGDLLKWFPAGLLVLVTITCLIFRNLYIYPRFHFSKLNKRILFYQSFRDGIYAISWVLILIFSAAVVLKYLHENYPAVWNMLAGFKAMLNWQFLTAGLFFVAFYVYFSTFKNWLIEKHGCPKINWKSERDIPLMVLSCCLIYAPVSLLLVPRDGGKAIHDAVIGKNLREVKNLLQRGHSIDSRNQYGFTPIMTAARRGNLEAFNYLLSKGASLEGEAIINNKQKGNLPYLALVGGKIEIVKKLFDKSKVNELWYKFTPLHVASNMCNLEVADYLIENGAGVNMLSYDGQTPLHLASRSNCFPVVAILLEAGADPTIKDKFKKLASEYGSKSSRSPAALIKRKLKKKQN